MEQIRSISVAPETFGERWGVVVNDYQYAKSAQNVDFETLLIDISKQRATTVEGEITPLSQTVRRRNAKLEELGEALSQLQGLQACFKDDAEGTQKLKDADPSATVADSLVTLLKSLGMSSFSSNPMKREVDEALQLVKTKIDRLNNDAQSDMTRLQGLVDKRDESYNTASSFMTEVSGTRSTAIRNM